MEQIYKNKMNELGYSQLVCDIFTNWENVKDEILIPERKTGSGNGTIHIFLGAADADLRKEFSSYYLAVEKGEDPAVSAVKIVHYFLPSNIISILGYVCQYCYSKQQDIGEYISDIINALSLSTMPNGMLSAISLFKLSLGSNKLRPYFKQFNANGAFTQIIRKVLLPNSSYKISLYKNSRNEYAAFWLLGFNSLSDFEIDSTDLHFKKTDDITLYQSYQRIFRTYITAIKSKPFLLLAGISGTGKSRIVRELARACWEEGSEEYKAQKPKNFEMIQVKPNWHDSSELIGYVSRIDGEKFVVGPFLKFIAKAIQNPDVPYFLCLDEMNLAPVEQYFAEYLSVIESRKWDNGEIVTDPIIDYEPTDAYKSLIDQLFYDDETRKKYLTKENGERLRIPQNLIVVGTVNMDETTFSFSRKVLDRAMTIEMNEVDLEGGLDKKYESIGKLGAAELIGNAVEGVDVYADNKGVCDRVINYLKAINGELEGTPFKVAYRTRNEFLLYVVNNLPYNKDENGEDIAQEVVMARALDEITSMKILSRIEGDTEKIGDLLDRLKEVIKKQLNEISSGKEYSGTKDKEGTEYAVSLAKLKEMKNRLKSGYTSFWS